MIPAATLDALRAVVGPAGFIDPTTAGSEAAIEPYLTDFRRLYRGKTPLVLLPATTGEVAGVLRICHAQRVGVVPHGGNTGYCGGATPDDSGTQVVLALKRLNRIRHLAPLEHTVTVEAGCVLGQLRAAAEDAGCYFPLGLGSEGSCQIGGNIATNAGGTSVLRYGMMRELVLGLEVVLADGRVLNGLRSLRKDNSGYDLKHMFIGSEGTLGVITAACLRLFPAQQQRATSLAAIPDPAAAVALLAQLRAASGDAVSSFELIPRLGMDLAVAQIDGVIDPFESAYPWYALMELSSSQPGNALEETLQDALTAAAEQGLVIDAVLTSNLQQRAAMWRLRENIPEAQRRAGASIKHDIALPIAVLPEFVQRATEAVHAIAPDGQVLAYGHVGDGNLHFNVQQRPGSDAAAFLARAPQIHEAVYRLVAEYHGSFSAEHGIGRLKMPQLQQYKSAVELEVMRTLKRALDPQGILNPGKVIG